MSFLFADDTKVFTKSTDHTILQQDLDSLLQWSSDWQLHFNVDKCKVIHYGKKKPKHKYTMVTTQISQPLRVDLEEKDLGVLFDEDLKFRKHVGAICNKANRMIGLVRRTFKYMDKEIFLTLFKSMIRPHVEYACTVWDPLLKGDIKQIEKVQRRATKLLKEIKDDPYPERLKYLRLPSLTFRRLRSDMIQTFKILKGFDDMEPSILFKMDPNRNTRGHSLKLSKQCNRTTIRNHFFSQRVINPWNSLPQEVVDAESINSFKGKLEKHWAEHPLRYNPPD